MKRGVRLVSLEREERGEYPIKAVREAIINAVAHCDYSIRGDEIRIFMFNDRIEFYSPGRLPGHVTTVNDECLYYVGRWWWAGYLHKDEGYTPHPNRLRRLQIHAVR
jgi:hypothetical protein